MEEWIYSCIGRVEIQLYWQSGDTAVLEEWIYSCIGRVEIQLYWQSGDTALLNRIYICVCDRKCNTKLDVHVTVHRDKFL